MKKNIKEEELEELREHLEGGTKKKIKKVNIIFDGKQTTIRIPLEFVEIMEIDPNKDVFEFEIEMPPALEKENKPKLYGRLIKNA